MALGENGSWLRQDVESAGVNNIVIQRPLELSLRWAGFPEAPEPNQIAPLWMIAWFLAQESLEFGFSHYG